MKAILKGKELFFLEEFKHCAHGLVVVYLNERKVFSVSEAAGLVDDFGLTQKKVFKQCKMEPILANDQKYKTVQPSRSNSSPRSTDFFYCSKVTYWQIVQV